MTEKQFGRFLAISLDTLERELPAGYALLVQSLGCRAVSVQVDGESLGIVGDGTRVVIESVERNPHTWAAGTSQALVALLDGDMTLEEAIVSERIQLRGELQHLIAFCAALRSYFSAAVRCPSFPELLERYLEAASIHARSRKSAW